MIAVMAGAAAALGHAPFGYWWAALPGFAILISIIAQGRLPFVAERKGFRAAPALRASRHRAGWLAWLGGVGYFGVTMHWIVEPFLVDAPTHGWMAPFALILLAGGLALFWALAAVLAMRLAAGRTTRALALAVALTGAEVIRGHIFTGFPWALPAYIWAETPLRGVVAITGSYGLTLLTLLGVALVTTFRIGVPGIVAASAFFGSLFFLGHAQLQDAEARDLGLVRLVQPNVPQSEKWQRDKVPEHLDRLFSLTSAAATDGDIIDLVVWPEAAVVYPLDQAGGILAQAARAAGSEAEVILGINRRNEENEWFNALAMVGADGTVQDTFDKVHLVPFGEYIPFRIEFLRAMAASNGFGFTAGEAVRLIDTPLGRALPLICYEGIFPRHLFRAGERPDYILLITNDAWFGTFSGPYQHLDQARFRAVEHGLPVVRVANTGVSTVIDRFGSIDPAASLGLGQTGHLDRRVVTSTTPTLYARTGDWPTIVLVLVTLSALGFAKRRNAIANGGAAS